MDNWSDLPRLPAPFVSRRTVQFALGDNVKSGLFDADQIRAYARKAQADLIGRLAQMQEHEAIEWLLKARQDWWKS